MFRQRLCSRLTALRRYINFVLLLLLLLLLLLIAAFVQVIHAAICLITTTGVSLPMEFNEKSKNEWYN